jgi:hypothetical protein
VISPQKPC